MYQRDKSLDVFKGLLVFGMIYSHVLLLLSKNVGIILSLEWDIAQFINMITFSGFMFCFGYAYQIAYFSKDIRDVYSKIIISGIKPLIGFYISGITVQIFVLNKLITGKDILKILTLEDIPMFSEFLIAFALIAFITLIFFNCFKKLIVHSNLIFLVIFISLLSSFIPYDKVTINQIGLFIGTTNFYGFPVIQYLPFFVIGLYFSKYNVKFNLKFLIISMISTSIYLIYYLKTGELPSRFPPSIYFLLGSMFFLYMYYLLSNKVGENIFMKIFQLIGKNVLYYLIVSNIIIFVFYNKTRDLNITAIDALGVTILIVSLIGYLTIIINKFDDKNRYLTRL